MRDLLTDISGPESSNDIFGNLATLEQELDSNSNVAHAHNNVNVNNNNININENGIAPPGMNKSSAGAMVVGHASHSTPFRDARTSNTNNTTTSITTTTPVNAQDAFAQSLQQFSALSLTDDFLKADSARKEHMKISHINDVNVNDANANDIVNNLFQGEDTEEYDVQQDADVLAKNQGRDQMAQLFPGFGSGTGANANVGSGANANVGGIKPTQTPQPQPSSQQQQGRPGSGMPPPHMRGPPPPGSNGPPPPGSHQGPPPPHMMHHPPHMMGPPGPGPGQHGHGHGHGMPPPPHMMGPGNGMNMPPPHHMMHQGHGPGPPHGPGPRGPPPGPGPRGMAPPQPHHMQPGPGPGGPGNGMPMPPPHHMMMMHMQQQQMMQQQQAMQANQNQGRPQGPPGTQGLQGPPGTLPAMQQSLPQQQQPQKTIPTKVFKKTDFPALGADASQIEQEKEEEEKRELVQKEERKQEARRSKPSAAQQPQPHPHPVIRMTFHNPSPSAAPIPANAIQCTSMTSRDLCYVLHSMLRPVLSYASVLDAYNADYYRWSYDDRKSRNLLFLGGNAPSHMNTNLPNPVWKETKVKAQEMEDKFRTTIEKRADEWTKEKQALGRVVKVNVKRPRALLATTALSSSSSSANANANAGEEQKDSGDGDTTTVADTEEDRQRAFLWAGRVAIDKGYQAYLSLVELRRLLQSRPGDALNGEDSVVHRREELLKDVEENVSKLQGAFGLKKVDGGIECDDKILARTLTLPKGRMLLSRVVDEGILPHPSACKVLPNAIKVVFDSASTGDLAAAPPAGEDRLLRSLTGLVKTEHPSVDPTNLLQCLISTINAENVINGEKRSMKAVLTSKRTLMELLYAVFSRGGEVCVGGFESDWKDKESKFLAILSAS